MGVRKHRTLESMNALRESWADANFAAYQERLDEQRAEIEGRER